MKRRSSRRRVVIERDETRFHIGETSSSDDEANGNMRRGAQDENTFAGVRQVLLWHKTYFRTENYSVCVRATYSTYDRGQSDPKHQFQMLPLKDDQPGDLRRRRPWGGRQPEVRCHPEESERDGARGEESGAAGHRHLPEGQVKEGKKQAAAVLYSCWPSHSAESVIKE